MLHKLGPFVQLHRSIFGRAHARLSIRLVGLGEFDLEMVARETNDVVCDVASLVQKANWKPTRRNAQQTYHNGGRTVAKKKATEEAAPAAAAPKKAATKKAATKKAAPESATKKAATKKAATKKAAAPKAAKKKKK